MMKYLLLALAIYLIYRVWKKRNALPPDKPSQSAKAPEQMVRCSFCGVHLPESDAISELDKIFCSSAHRDQALRG